MSAAGRGDATPLAVLLERSATGDQAAFAVLYAQTAPAAFGLALRVLGDQARAEDATRDAYLTVWRTAAVFDARRGNASAWILAAVHRAAVDRVRQTPSRPAVARVRATSPHPQEALELAYFGGHTYGEVADLLGVPVGAAMSSIRDGLVRLRASSGPPRA